MENSITENGPLPWLGRRVHSLKKCLFILGCCLASAPVSLVAQTATLGKHAATGKQAMVATVNSYATDAGVRAFAEGGNAIDAALAAAVMLGAVDSHNSGLGGGCFVLIRTADGRVAAIDGREMAPAAATRDMFLRDGKADPALSREGPLAAGVPGALAAYERAARNHGKLGLSKLLTWAADRADEGYRVDRSHGGTIRSTFEKGLDRFPGLKSIIVKPDGQPYAEGETLRNVDLAASYRQIAKQGTDWFYRGEFARAVAGWMKENGGLLTEEDFANYVAKSRVPIRSKYRDYEVIGFPPPSSGGVHVAQMLNILEHFDLAQLHQDDPAVATHVIVEAMKLAFADRAYWLGDADFVDVPKGLAGESYAAKLAKRIQTDRAIDVPEHGQPEGWAEHLFNKHTTHIATADAEGNWVAITATVNTSFGSKVVVPGTGIVLNNEMDDFSAQPGVPNAFGLLGAENNAVEPGKRPLSSMSPTIVLHDGEPVLTVGAAGGPKIITQALLTIVRVLDYGLPLDEAIERPRFHHQWMPNQVYCETEFPVDVQLRLMEMGHKIKAGGTGGRAQAITHSDGELIGVHDPRVPGKALGR